MEIIFCKLLCKFVSYLSEINKERYPKIPKYFKTNDILLSNLKAKGKKLNIF